MFNSNTINVGNNLTVSLSNMLFINKKYTFNTIFKLLTSEMRYCYDICVCFNIKLDRYCLYLLFCDIPLKIQTLCTLCIKSKKCSIISLAK